MYDGLQPWHVLIFFALLAVIAATIVIPIAFTSRNRKTPAMTPQYPEQQQPVTNYQPPPGYQSPPPGYQSPPPGYQSPPPGYYPPQPYAPQQFQGVGPDGKYPAEHDALAIIGFIASLIWLFWAGSIVAVILGHIHLNQAKKLNRKPSGLAIAGLVLGYIGVALLLLGVVFAIVGATVSSNGPGG